MIGDLDYRIAKLDMKPGDILVAKFDYAISEALHTRILDYFKSVTSQGIELLVLERGCDVSVLTFDEIQALAKTAKPTQDGNSLCGND